MEKKGAQLLAVQLLLSLVRNTGFAVVRTPENVTKLFSVHCRIQLTKFVIWSRHMLCEKPESFRGKVGCQILV